MRSYYDMDKTTEYLFNSETAAKDQRRIHIAQGYAVTLISFDPIRNAYVFDSEKPVS